MTRARPPALLLLGPTGSGKSPAGRALALRTGWYHLDFGARLREIAEGPAPATMNLAAGEHAFIAHLVETSALFPDDALPLVVRVVECALEAAGSVPRVVLNGVPRTRAQAAGLAALVDVDRVAVLDAAPDAVAARIAARYAGLTSDDAGRADDTLVQVARRLALFESETRPLVGFYRALGARVDVVPVGARTEADEIVRALLDGGAPRGSR